MPCSTKNCHCNLYSDYRIFGYCPYCKCSSYNCKKVVGEYGYCEDHRCSEPGCCKKKSENCQHSYYESKPKCRMCKKRSCYSTDYCNEHGCMWITFINDKYIHCKNPAKLGWKNCDEHLAYCQSPSDCIRRHEKGRSRCNYHASYFSDPKHYSCGSTECKKCPVRRNFLLTFFTSSLGCDFPILEAVVEHSTFPVK
jgi:hypothetical protein